MTRLMVTADNGNFYLETLTSSNLMLYLLVDLHKLQCRTVDLVIIFNMQLRICLMVNLRDSCILHSFVWSGPVLVSITGTGACIVIAQGHSKILALPIRFNGLRTEDSVP